MPFGKYTLKSCGKVHACCRVCNPSWTPWGGPGKPWGEERRKAHVPWNAGIQDPYTPEAVMRMSQSRRRGIADGTIPVRGGKRTWYKEIGFRSTWEARFASWLDKIGIPWLYEPKLFELSNSTYLPDFYLPHSGNYVEIKGWDRGARLAKVEEFQRTYHLPINILRQADLRALGVL